MLIKGDKYTEIAEKVPCSRQTIYDWLKDETFKAEMDKYLLDIKTTAQNKILGKTDTYLSKMEELAFTSASDNVKLNALQFLWETVYGKATTKIETNSIDDDKTKTGKSMEELMEDLTKVENNVINLKDISQG